MVRESAGVALAADGLEGLAAGGVRAPEAGVEILCRAVLHVRVDAALAQPIAGLRVEDGLELALGLGRREYGPPRG